MSVFNKTQNNSSKLDWRLLMNGSIALYHSDSILKQDMDRLKAYGYQLAVIDFSIIDTEEMFHELIKEKLVFPEYYGGNLAAFSDCLLYDLEIPETGGIAIVFTNFDKFYENNWDFAQELLERLDLNARRRMLYGERFVTLIQINDRKTVIEKVGSHNIVWNLKESTHRDKSEKE